MTKKAKRQMEALGFVEIATGGGCTAWCLESGKTRILVTDDASHELGETCCVDVEVDGESLLSFAAPTRNILREGRSLLFGVVGE